MRDLGAAALKSAGGTTGSLFLSAIAGKIVALMVGLAGTGFYSMLRQIQLAAVTFGNVGGQTALIHGVSKRESSDRRVYLEAVWWIFAAGAVLVAVALLVFGPVLSLLLFPQEQAANATLLRLTAIPAFFGVWLIYYVGILAGLKAIDRVALTQLITASATALLAYPICLLVLKGHREAFLLLLTVPIICATAYARSVTKSRGLLPRFTGRFGPRDRAGLQEFTRTAAAVLLMGVSSACAILAIRATVGKMHGLEAVGLFEAAWTPGMTYMSILLNSLSAFYLPTLSAASRDARDLEIRRMLTFGSAIAVPLITFMVVFKAEIVALLYTAEFTPAAELLRWMLVADVLKVASWILAMSLISAERPRELLMLELLWNAVFVSISLLGLKYWSSIETIGVAFLVAYTCYFTAVWWRVGWRLVGKIPVFTKSLWAVGLVIIGLASAATWDAKQSTQTPLLVALLVSGILVGGALLRVIPSASVGDASAY